MKGKLIAFKCAVALIMCTITCNIAAQRVSLDSLNSAQLRQNMAKAVKLRNTGRAMVLVPPVLGAITGLGILFPEDESEQDMGDVFNVLFFYTIAATAIPLMITGAILWATGSTRIDRIDIALKKFNMTPQNSMALGVAITFNLRF